MKKLFLMNPKIQEFKYKVIYGAGKEGQMLYEKLLSDGLEITYFADSNSQIHGMEIMGKEVISLEQLKTMNDSTAVLLSKGYEDQIYNMLVGNGIKNIFLSHVENGLLLDD